MRKHMEQDAALALANAANFWNWLEGAKHGDRFVYHVGLLSRDRLKRYNRARYCQVDRIGKAVLTAAVKGDVKLFQMKSSDASYSYIARRQKPPQPIEWIGCYHPAWIFDHDSKPVSP